MLYIASLYVRVCVCVCFSLCSKKRKASLPISKMLRMPIQIEAIQWKQTYNPKGESKNQPPVPIPILAHDALEKKEKKDTNAKSISMLPALPQKKKERKTKTTQKS